MLQVLREPKLDAAGSALDVIFKITSQAMNEFFFILLLSIFLFTSIKANKYTIHPRALLKTGWKPVLRRTVPPACPSMPRRQ